MTYSVNNSTYESFSSAVAAAKDIGAEVFEVATGKRRWAPAPRNTKSITRHVLVNADGSETEFSKVGR